MKNKFFQKTSLLVFVTTLLLSLLFIGCKNKKSNEDIQNIVSNSPTADLSIIPYDATFVVHLDLKSIWEKGELDNADQVSFIKLLKQELRDEEPEASKIVNNLIDNPNSCGLNLKGDIFAFRSESMKTELCIGFTVKDSDQFKNFLMDLEKNLGIGMSFSTEGSYNTAYSKDIETAFCWNNAKAYIYPVVYDRWDDTDPQKNVRDYASRLMTLDESESMSRNNDFKTFMGSGNDWGWFFNTRKVMQMLEDSDYGDAMTYLDEYKNTSICLSLNFEKGCIKMQGSILGMEEKSLGQGAALQFNKDLLNYLPQQTLAAATYSYSMENIIKNMDDNGMSHELDEEFNRGGFTVRKLLQCFTGNIAISLSDIKLGGYYGDNIEPEFTVVGEINNSLLIKQALDEMESDNDLTRLGDTYTTKDGDISIKVSDNVLMVSNDQPTLNAFSRGGNGNGIANIAAKAEKGNYLYLDLDPANYPSAVKNNIDSRVLSLLENFLNNAEIKVSPNYNCEIVVNLKNDEKNSLKCLIDHIDDNLVTLERLTR